MEALENAKQSGAISCARRLVSFDRSLAACKANTPWVDRRSGAHQPHGGSHGRRSSNGHLGAQEHEGGRQRACSV